MTDGGDGSLTLGTVRFDPAHGMLWDASSNAVTMSDRALQLLSVLVEHRDQAVETRDLIAQVWGVSEGAEDTLIQCIAEIRRAIGDEAKTTIQTVPGLGYKLITTQPVVAKRQRGRVLRYVGVTVAVLPIVVVLFALVASALGGGSP